MTSNYAPGVRFEESVYVPNTVEEESPYIPLFIIAGTDVLPCDNVLTLFEDYNAFTQIRNNGFAKAAAIIKRALAESGQNKFYLYSNKTDTKESYKNIFIDSANKEEIKKAFYLETVASSNNNSLNNKIKGIQEGLEDNYNKGVFRTCTIVPLGTVSKAVETKEEGAVNEAVVITALTNALDGVESSRIQITVPDTAYNGQLVGKLLETPYNREAGYTAMNIKKAFDYDFSAGQVDTLRGMGVLFAQEEFTGNESQYRIHLGVNTNYKGQKADGLIKSREIADELLRQVKFACLQYIKNEDITTSKVMIQTDCDTIVQRFINNNDVEEMVELEGEIIKTKLNVQVVDRYSAVITGTILPVGEVLQITVNTTIM